MRIVARTGKSIGNEMSIPRKQAGLNGWSVAAALGLLVAAFLIDRAMPGEERPSSPADDLPPHSDERRDASSVEIAGEVENRGRRASTPSEIPVSGWKDILWRVYANISDHRILALAAGMTYYSILAICPALAALVAIYGIFTDPGTIAKHMATSSASYLAAQSTWRASS